MVEFRIEDSEKNISTDGTSWVVRVEATIDGRITKYQWYDIWYEDDELMIDSNGTYLPDSVFLTHTEELYYTIDKWIDKNIKENE